MTLHRICHYQHRILNRQSRGEKGWASEISGRGGGGSGTHHSLRRFLEKEGGFRGGRKRLMGILERGNGKLIVFIRLSTYVIHEETFANQTIRNLNTLYLFFLLGKHTDLIPIV